jgi:DNA-binding winged helix-turn-helix (wHTH) protein
VSTDDPLLLRFHPFELDERQARLTRAGQPVAMAPKAFAVLCTLARAPGQLVRKDALLDTVWGHRHVSESVLKTIVSELRAALGDDAKRPRFIETASRHGYRFIAALQTEASVYAVPVPCVLDGAGPAALIGRAAAHEQLHVAWQGALAGRRQMVWLSGEAGIGKTTLIEHFIGSLEGLTVAHGQCVEQSGAGEPYLPVLEALASLCRDDPALLALLRQVAPTWLLQLPWLSSEAEHDALRQRLAGIGQERMLREFGELLDRATQARPLLLVTEDLHWSDQATLRLIDHIARRRTSARLMWLASFRIAEVIAEDHPLKALRHELRLHRLAGEIALDPFSEREVADYAARRLNANTVPEALARALHARTDGLPLFVASVLDEWAAQGVQASDAPARAAMPDAAVPESLAGVIEKQIERLPPLQRQLLEAASVCGVEFDSITLADVVGADAAEVGARCDELARRQQWLSARAIDAQRDGTLGAHFAFRHALYRQVFYQRIGALARARWHRGVAESIARRRGTGIEVSAAELALHHELGHDVPNALRHYAEAAEAALRRFAPAEAMGLTDHALGLLPSCPDGTEKLELEIALLGPRTVAASHVVGVTAPETMAAYERVEVLCDLVPNKSRALEVGSGWAHYVRGDYARAWARAAHLHALAQQRDDRMLQVAACNLSGAVASYRGELMLAREWLQRGIDAAAGLSERLATSLTVVDLGVSLRARFSQVLLHLGEVDAARAQIAAANERARTLAPYALRLVQIFEGFLEAKLERHERVQTLAESIRHLADEHGIAQAGGTSRWLRGLALARLGQPLEGHALIVEGYAIDERIGVMRGRSGVLGYAVDALLLAGRWADAQRELDAALALAQRLGERLHLPDLLLLQGRVAFGQGDLAAARASMQAAREEARQQQALWLELAACVALCGLDDSTRHDFDVLAAVRAQLREGTGEALAARADALLAQRVR